jgi:hypothetical protein
MLKKHFVDSVLVYNSLTGGVTLQCNGNEVYVLDINSASGSFIPQNVIYPAGYDAAFSGADPGSMAIESIGSPMTGNVFLGNFMTPGFTADQIAGDWSGVYGVDGILGDQQIIVVTVGSPEPAFAMLVPPLLLLWRPRRK